MALKIIFMGTPGFALPSLDKLADSGHELLAVVTVPDKPAGRGQRLRPSTVKERALQRQLPLLQPEDLRDPDFLAALQRLNADLFAVVAFRILPPEVFKLPRLGTVNLHASLLPRYRGAAPINWALIRGEQETGVTTFLIDEQIDTGAWLLQCRVPIGPDTNAGELHDLLAATGADLLLQTVQGLESGRLQSKPQIGEVTRAPKLTREMARIDWHRSAREIHNLVRGLSPYPAAWTTWKGRTVKILATRPVPAGPSEDPGRLISGGGREALFLATGDGVLELVTLQPEGGRIMSAAEFMRGHAVTAAEKME
ncbi:MAG TPA: methionyl-tRNA formyltransferase [bacterium]|nr:methionyl-tRNA formyltransferase [bacterium]HQG45263.1 methionyl-tRNA formyltransferase [bacterium]HQJ65558.1 methionyl-tRNA formyltransferase [bacterium]